MVKKSVIIKFKYKSLENILKEDLQKSHKKDWKKKGFIKQNFKNKKIIMIL
jgi:hypothetical protein